MGGVRKTVLLKGAGGPSNSSPAFPNSLFNAHSDFFEDAVILTDELISRNVFRDVISGSPLVFSHSTGDGNGNQVMRGSHGSDSFASGKASHAAKAGSFSEDNAVNQFDDSEDEGCSKAYTCLSCSAAFESLLDQRSHFKTDWHRFNVKRRAGNKKTVGENEFLILMEEKANQLNSKRRSVENINQEFESDVSSISGSDSGGEEFDTDQRIRFDLRIESNINAEPNSSPHFHSGLNPSGYSDFRSNIDSHPHIFSINRSPKALVYLKTKNVFISLWRTLIFDKSTETTEQALYNLKTLAIKNKQKSNSISNKKNGSDDGDENNNNRQSVWIILLSSGGHFAGIVVDYYNDDDGKIIDHQTFHRYVVRAKAGGRQSTKDARMNIKKSAGSSLRRYNEFALQKEIRELIYSWKEHIRNAKFIFMHTPSSNESMYMDEDHNYPLQKNDARIIKIPFTVKRPTFNEACRVAQNLAYIDYVALPTLPFPSPSTLMSSPPFTAEAPASSLSSSLSGTETSSGTELAPPLSSFSSSVSVSLASEAEKIEEIEEIERDARKIEVRVGKGEEEVLGKQEERKKQMEQKELIEQGTHKEQNEKIGQEEQIREEQEEQIREEQEEKGEQVFRTTELHIAAASGNGEKVRELLEARMDPTTKNENGKTAYALAVKKEIKNIFRKRMTSYPQEWDWSKAGVLAPLTHEMEEQELLRKAEKDARKKAKEKERKAQKKAAIKMQKEKEEAERKKKATPNPTSKPAMSEAELEREKRARAAEKRIQSMNSNSNYNTSSQNSNWSGSKCDCCGICLDGKVPFHRFSYRYCSTHCVRAHMASLDA